MSMSLTLLWEQIERLLAGFDSITMGIDAVRSALSESANVEQPQQIHCLELSIPSIGGIRWKIKGGGEASPRNEWAFVFAKN
jgi:hypothetical protein